MFPAGQMWMPCPASNPGQINSGRAMAANTGPAQPFSFLRVYHHARRSSASYMSIYAPMRHAPAHGTRLASLRCGICTAAASAIILQAAPETPSEMTLALVLHPPGGLAKPEISRRVIYLGHGSASTLAWRKGTSAR